jgi:predicted RNA-binding protein YlqC (UPF0109 family)
VDAIVDLLEVLCRALVERREEVRVRERREGEETVLEVAVAPEDRGRIVGRQGRTVDALRVLIAAVANERGQRCRVEVAR